MVREELLKAKGWSDEEIHHAMEILRKADESKHPRLKLFDQVLYWILLLIVLFGNVAFSIALLPVIITLNTFNVVLILAFTGFIFGTVCTTLLRMIDRIDTKHHVVYMVLIPLAGILTFIIVTTQANRAVDTLGFGATHHWSIGLAYLICFFIPYALIMRGDEIWT